MRNLTRAQKARLSHHRNGFYDSKEIDLNTTASAATSAATAPAT